MDKADAFFLGLVAGSTIIGSVAFFVGLFIGAGGEMKKAIASGAGKWTVDPETGETEFVYGEVEK